MKTKLSDKEMELINDVSALLSTDYELKDNQISVDDCLRIIEDLKDNTLYLQSQSKAEDTDDDFDSRYDDYRLGLL